MKKEQKIIVNPETGEIDFKYNQVDIQQDYWLGTPADNDVVYYQRKSLLQRIKNLYNYAKRYLGL